MSYKTCPEWPELMELAPELQFKHFTVADTPEEGGAAGVTECDVKSNVNPLVRLRRSVLREYPA